MLTLLSFVLSSDVEATAVPENNQNNSQLGFSRNNLFPHIISSAKKLEVTALYLQLSILCSIILLICLFPSKKMKGFQDSLLTGCCVYFFVYEHFAFKFLSSTLNLIFLLVTFGSGIFLANTPLKNIVNSVTNAYITGILFCAILGIKQETLFILLEVITGAMFYLLLSKITVIFNIIKQTTTFTYLGCMILSPVLDVIGNSFEYIGMSQGISKFIIIILLAAAFFLPGILALFKTAIFGIEKDEPAKVEEKTEV